MIERSVKQFRESMSDGGKSFTFSKFIEYIENVPKGDLRTFSLHGASSDSSFDTYSGQIIYDWMMAVMLPTLIPHLIYMYNISMFMILYSVFHHMLKMKHKYLILKPYVLKHLRNNYIRYIWINGRILFKIQSINGITKSQIRMKTVLNGPNGTQ